MSIEAGVTATAPTVSAIVLTATVGCHLLKISGYSQTRLVDNGERVESAKFKAAGHTWRIVFYPNGKYSMDHGAFSFYLKLIDRSKGVDAEIQFSLLPRHGADSGTLPYSKPEIMHTFGSARRNSKCGFNWFISRDEMETLQNNSGEGRHRSRHIRARASSLLLGLGGVAGRQPGELRLSRRPPERASPHTPAAQASSASVTGCPVRLRLSRLLPG
ncbi:hypothetical protein OsJ_09037 [Oryza sativa Japonica Group]|uniref:MATH domain-containing protein n=1 Tax=Oryza sativa subsp. japonica TaxID=39947 RepID=B9F9Z2_ORYSJ|nr:hypothetical protein OsJ_09037 [Oryza sativa Japonica Group]